jgi:hypothetical protein
LSIINRWTEAHIERGRVAGETFDQQHALAIYHRWQTVRDPGHISVEQTGRIVAVGGIGPINPVAVVTALPADLRDTQVAWVAAEGQEIEHIR